ncbi:hypothetical protein CJF31_00010051 [Rutstroemia sp. NJR-2017a BVV2]|nr:hypothetical protein CJF31_00010051 [Rutstroemia sp. NJR-2017a BVV2]
MIDTRKKEQRQILIQLSKSF